MYQELNDGLYDELAGDADILLELGGTAIYKGIAPNGTSTPYIIYNIQAGGSDNDTPIDSVDVVLLVKAVSTDSREAETIADLVRARLHEAELTLDAPWTNYRTQHTSIVDFVEQVDREQFYHVGGLYRVRNSM